MTTIGQLERLSVLSAGAEDQGQFSAAINAEKIRSALGGLTIDRRENINTLDQLSRDDIVARLADLQKKYPQAFVIEGQMKDVTNGKRSRIKSLAKDKEATVRPECHLTRIESSTGLGIPDVHIVWDGLPFWLELKVAKVNAVRVSLIK